MKKRTLSLIICIVMLTQFLTVSFTVGAAPDITSQGACVMDFETGEVLYEFNGNVPRVPASMTKIMNMYCIYEALKNGEITLNTVVPISKNVYDKSRNATYQSVLPLYYNTTYTVDEMMSIIVTYSASGAAIAMAELIAGSEEAYVKRMNDMVGRMGLDAYYYDSCGIANNRISPISMAKLARNIIRDYPDIITRSSKKSVTFHGNTYKTTNRMLDTYAYAGADGLKTGTTPAAGYCFCGTAVRNGRRMIAVTMSSSSTGQRFIDTAALLDYGFSKAPAGTAPGAGGSANTSGSSPATAGAAAQSTGTGIYYTDISTFINGHEVPSFMYRGDTDHAVVVAEDLANYGFDIYYDIALETLYLTYNSSLPVNPMPLEYYKNRNGSKAFDIYPSNVRVYINNGIDSYFITDAYSINGYMCISIDEFAKFADYSWNPSSRSAHITMKELPAAAKEPVETVTPVVQAPPQAQETPAPEYKAVLPNGVALTSGSAYIMDFETGKPLYGYDENTQKPVASIAKMMSVYVILDAIRDGKITLQTQVPISENVYRLSRVEDYKMMVNLEYNEVYTVDEMIDMIIIDSAAACVTAVAELISGSEAEFVKLMNEKAKEIGISSVFYNGTGVCLNPETDKENLMSAAEVAVMTRRMIQDYPEVLERTKRASVDFHGKTYYNLNKMFTDYYYKGADGFKNGMTTASGYCMCGTAMLDGKRVITVTLPSESNEARFTDTAKMFDYGFSQLSVDTAGASVNPNTPAFDSAKGIKIYIDGNYEMHFSGGQPVVINDQLMVPVRQMMETLEKTVTWSEAENRVIISDMAVSLILTPDSDIMIAENTNPYTGKQHIQEIKLKAAPLMLNNTCYAPLKAVAEAFGAAVIWEEETQTYLVIAGVC